MGLARQLGIDTDDMSWRDWAACKGLSSTNDEGEHPFFEQYESDKSSAKAIDALCSSCIVQQACGNYGSQHRLEGVWGGVYQDGRGGYDRPRNSHKTDAEWRRLREIFDWI